MCRIKASVIIYNMELILAKKEYKITWHTLALIIGVHDYLAMGASVNSWHVSEPLERIN